MKILIIGGSGILSTDFTKKVLDTNNEVYILNRGRRKTYIDNRARLIVADLREESIETIKKKISVNQYNVVVDFLSYNVEQMKKTLEVLDKRYQQYVFISSATVYIKKNKNEIITEKTPIGNQKWDYAYNKSLCEYYLKENDFNYTIVRPYVTYGDSRIPFQIIPDGFHYTLIERIKENKPVILLDSGEALCTLTHTVDFAEVLYRLLLNEKAYREEFHITSSYTYKWKDVYETLCRVMGKQMHLVSVSLEEVKQFFPEFYQVLKGDKGTNMRFDNSRVIQVTGAYNFQIDLEEGVKRSVAYFEEHDEMKGIDFKWDGKIDYYLKKSADISTKRLKLKNAYSNKTMFYFVLKYQPFRKLYELARKANRIVKGEN